MRKALVFTFIMVVAAGAALVLTHGGEDSTSPTISAIELPSVDVAPYGVYDGSFIARQLALVAALRAEVAPAWVYSGQIPADIRPISQSVAVAPTWVYVGPFPGDQTASSVQVAPQWTYTGPYPQSAGQTMLGIEVAPYWTYVGPHPGD